MEREKSRRIVSWLFFTAILALICILSFQNGNATKALDRSFVGYVAGEGEGGVYTERTRQIIYLIRQTGRAVLFLALGVSWGSAAEFTFEKARRWKRLAGSAAVLAAICYLTEKAKIFIEGRHYAFEECVGSFAFSMLGYLLSAILLWCMMKRSRRYVSEKIELAEPDHHYH